MGRLAETGTRVSSYPGRRTWRVWWRSAPAAVAWRNAAALVPRTRDPQEPAAETAAPVSAQVFRERPSLW